MAPLHEVASFVASAAVRRGAAVRHGGMRRPGVTLFEVSHRIGHSSIAITADRYGHLIPDRDDAASAAVGALIAHARAEAPIEDSSQAPSRGI